MTGRRRNERESRFAAKLRVGDAARAVSSQRLGAMLKHRDSPLVERYDCVLLDLDGVVYVGPRAVEGAAAVLARVRERGISVAFVTNNASRTPEAVSAKLRDFGVQAEPSDVVTSAQAAARELASRLPAGARVLVLGAEGLIAAVRDVGLAPVSTSDDSPVAVVQGFGPDIGWRQLSDAAVAIRNGAIWVAANTDLTIPTSRGPAPGNGSFVNALAAAVGSRPDVVAGKPHGPLFDETVRRTGSRRPLVVGDRLDTDIEGAVACEADSLLVMTGVTDVSILVRAPISQRPTYVAWTLQGLLTPHEAPSRGGADWRLGGWTASVSESRLLLRSPGGQNPDDGLRVAISAAWSWYDENPQGELDCDDVQRLFAGLGLMYDEGVPDA